MKTLYKILPITELSLWLLFFLIHFYEERLLNSVVVLAIMGIYILFPRFIFGSRGWKANLWAHIGGLILALGVYAVIFKYYYWAGCVKEVGLLVFWPALLMSGVCIINTFKSNQRRFFAEMSIRLAMVAILTIPFLLGWWM